MNDDVVTPEIRGLHAPQGKAVGAPTRAPRRAA
jgi:hypothetical protein